MASERNVAGVYCRICTSYLPINQVIYIDKEVYEKLAKCVPMIIDDLNRFHKYICKKCSREVDVCCNLVEKAIKSSDILLEVLENKPSKKKNTNITSKRNRRTITSANTIKVKDVSSASSEYNLCKNNTLKYFNKQPNFEKNPFSGKNQGNICDNEKLHVDRRVQPADVTDKNKTGISSREENVHTPISELRAENNGHVKPGSVIINGDIFQKLANMKNVRIMCDLCKSVYFSSVLSFQKHMNEQHKLVCDGTYEVFSDSTAVTKNSDTEFRGMFECYMCNECFRDQIDFINHTCLQDDKNVHVCHFCGLMFDSERALQIHFKLTHIKHNDIEEDNDADDILVKQEENDENHPNSNDDDDDDDGNDVSSLEKLITIVDDEEKQEALIDDVERVVEQMYITQQYEENNDDEDITIGELASNGKENDNKSRKFVAHRRVKKSDQPLLSSSVNDQQATVFGDKKRAEEDKLLQCPQCYDQVLFRSHCRLNRHLISVHNVSDPHQLKHFACKYCGKKVGSRLSLVDHERLHTGVKPFVCEMCGASFRSRANLLQHHIVHTGLKRYPCPVCSKNFSRKSFVRTHMRVHTGEKPYTCDVCSKAFTQVGDMRRHRKRHDQPPNFSE